MRQITTESLANELGMPMDVVNGLLKFLVAFGQAEAIPHDSYQVPDTVRIHLHPSLIARQRLTVNF